MKYLTQAEVFYMLANSGGMDKRRANIYAVKNTVAVWRKQYQTEATKEELYDNIDRPDRHNVAGPLNRPSEMQLAAYNKSKEYHQDESK